MEKKRTITLHVIFTALQHDKSKKNVIEWSARWKEIPGIIATGKTQKKAKQNLFDMTSMDSAMKADAEVKRLKYEGYDVSVHILVMKEVKKPAS